MKIKEQTRKLAAGCSKHSFEVVDKTDEVSDYIYGKAKLTWFEFDFRRVLVNLMLFFPRLDSPFMTTTFEIFNSLVNREPGNMIKVF